MEDLLLNHVEANKGKQWLYLTLRKTAVQDATQLLADAFPAESITAFQVDSKLRNVFHRHRIDYSDNSKSFHCNGRRSVGPLYNGSFPLPQTPESQRLVLTDRKASYAEGSPQESMSEILSEGEGHAELVSEYRGFRSATTSQESLFKSQKASERRLKAVEIPGDTQGLQSSGPKSPTAEKRPCPESQFSWRAKRHVRDPSSDGHVQATQRVAPYRRDTLLSAKKTSPLIQLSMPISLNLDSDQTRSSGHSPLPSINPEDVGHNNCEILDDGFRSTTVPLITETSSELGVTGRARSIIRETSVDDSDSEISSEENLSNLQFVITTQIESTLHHLLDSMASISVKSSQRQTVTNHEKTPQLSGSLSHSDFCNLCMHAYRVETKEDLYEKWAGSCLTMRDFLRGLLAI